MTTGKKWLIVIITTGVSVILLYGFLVEPYKVGLKVVTIRNRAFASTFRGLKIALLSDLHIGRKQSLSTKRTLEILEKLKPDLILLTGDYVQWNGGKQVYNNAIAFLSQLNAPLGVFAVMGDADYSFSRWSCLFCHEEGCIDPPKRHRVRFLRNAQVVIDAGGRKFPLIGIENNEYQSSLLHNLSHTLNERPAIVISHTSSLYREINANDHVLVLSGDTHGGQIFVPGFIWKLIKIKPDTAHRYGLFEDKNKMLYVTSGIGTSEVPFRFGAPPEVVLFEFTD